MEKQEIKECEKLIQKWKDAKPGKEKDRIRSNLFKIFRPTIKIWIISILKKRKVYIPPIELDQKCWDCFAYCLKHYKPGRIPPLNHFYSYTRFLVSLGSKPAQGNEETSQEQDEIVDKETDDLALVYEDIEELKFFRRLLPEEYVSVFDDAIMSMAPSKKDRVQRLKEIKIPYAKYHEVKKVFKIVVEFILVR